MIDGSWTRETSTGCAPARRTNDSAHSSKQILFLIGSGAHLLARFGARATGIGAFLHRRVVAHLRTIVPTAPAHVRTRAAGELVQIRSAEHEVRARLADLDAVLHQADVMRISMFSALVKTILHRFEAYLMTGRTLLDAVTHFRGNVLVSH